jgi:quercetin dioxygenase-like cupin family protein
MANEEMLSTYIARIEKTKPLIKNKHVVVSTDVPQRPIRGREGIKKVPIVWPLYQHNMFYIVTFPPATRIPKHRHDEDVFRYVIEGSLIVTAENKTYEVDEGMWIVVRANTEYSIAARSNPQACVALVAYTNGCPVQK